MLGMIGITVFQEVEGHGRFPYNSRSTSKLYEYIQFTLPKDLLMLAWKAKLGYSLDNTLSHPFVAQAGIRSHCQKRDFKKNSREKNEILWISNDYEICNWPCLTEESCVYACNAPSNASLNDNILYLEDLWHPKPATEKIKINGKEVSYSWSLVATAEKFWLLIISWISLRNI